MFHHLVSSEWQKNLEVDHLEETVEEYNDIIKVTFFFIVWAVKAVVSCSSAPGPQADEAGADPAAGGQTRRSLIVILAFPFFKMTRVAQALIIFTVCCCVFFSAVLTEVMKEEEGSVTLHLSLAEEIQMLVSSTGMKTTDLTPVTAEEEKHVKRLLFFCLLCRPNL